MHRTADNKLDLLVDIRICEQNSHNKVLEFEPLLASYNDIVSPDLNHVNIKIPDEDVKQSVNNSMYSMGTSYTF